MRLNSKLIALIVIQLVVLVGIITIVLINNQKEKSKENINAQAATVDQKLFGVNSAGAEFNEYALPGTYNTDYFYDTDASRLQYFSNKKLTLVRLPFLWERIQQQEFSSLSTSEVQYITAFLNAAMQANQQVILDLHNYGRYHHTPLQPGDANKFADVWKKIATQFKNHPALYGYELMNEPHDLPVADSWKGLAQAATDSIRSVDNDNWILVPGYSWQSARFWRDNNENLIISDPSNKVIYAAHIYFDGNYTGTYSNSYDADGAHPAIGVERIQPFLDWLRAKNVRGIFTEYGVPNNDPRWNVVLDNFMQVLQTNEYIVGGTYWAAGTRWGNYPLSVEPVNGQDAPQMSVLSKYTSGTQTSPVGTQGYIYGTIATETQNASTEVSKGIKLAHVDLNWSAYEPQDGAFDVNYSNQVKQKLQSLRAAGMQVVLGLGTHYAPNWVYTLPHSRYVNQYGDAYASQESGKSIPNFVFNQQVRDKGARYVSRVFSDLGTDFYAVRIGGGWYGEVNLGEKTYNGHTNSYWGYDEIAQGRASGLPSGISPVPVQGWKPGVASPNHASASQFANWYMDSQNNYIKWQIATVRQHYSGYLPLLLPSWGIRPGALEKAIAVDLNGSTGQESTGEVPMALDFARYVNSITDVKVIPYTTWLDAPYGDDASTDPNNWTPGHYLSSLAAAHPLRLKVWGETTGNNSYADMQRSFERMKNYNLMGIMWAFDKELFDGSHATLDQYAALINQYTPQPAVSTPTAAPNATATPIPTQTPTAGADTFTTSAIISPNVVSPGGSVTITATVKSTTGGTYLVDIEGKNSQGQKVYQQAFDNQVFAPGQTRTFTTTAPWVISSAGPTGTYTAQVGMFKPGWAGGLYFNNNAGSFTVSSVSIPTLTPTRVPTAVPTPTQIPTPTTALRGLTGSYFANQTLTGTPRLVRTDATINYSWGESYPASSLPIDRFSVRWTGYVVPRYSQTYTFYTQSDDGVRLLINGVQLVNNWTDHGSTQNSGKITLTAGRKYAVRMEYYENAGSAVAKLSWSSSSQSKQIIPQSQLYPQ